MCAPAAVPLSEPRLTAGRDRGVASPQVLHPSAKRPLPPLHALAPDSLYARVAACAPPAAPALAYLRDAGLLTPHPPLLTPVLSHSLPLALQCSTSASTRTRAASPAGRTLGSASSTATPSSRPTAATLPTAASVSLRCSSAATSSPWSAAGATRATRQTRS